MTEPLTAPGEEVDIAPPTTPRWVKTLGIVLVLLVVAFAALHLTGNVPTHGMPVP